MVCGGALPTAGPAAACGMTLLEAEPNLCQGACTRCACGNALNNVNVEEPLQGVLHEDLGITQITSTSAIQGGQQLADPLAVAGALQGNLAQAAANTSRGVTAGRQPVGLRTLQDDSLRCQRSGICEGGSACAQGEHYIMIRLHCGHIRLMCLSPGV